MSETGISKREAMLISAHRSGASLERVAGVMAECVAHWERVVAGEEWEDVGSSDCAACRAWRNSGADRCYACPIRITGGDNCRDTPYPALAFHMDQHDGDCGPECEDRRLLAQEELNFLRGFVAAADGVRDHGPGAKGAEDEDGEGG